MSEIEKMYKNANVEKHLAYFECHRGRSSTRKCPINYDERDEGCFYCSCENKMKEVYEYSPFTAEKQIELIKWLVHYIKQINITDAISGEFYFTAFGCVGNMKIDFEEALASLLNELWQNLTSEEKQQVKGILE